MAEHPVESYLGAHCEAEPELLAALSRETHVKMLHARMLSGHYQGRLLAVLSKLLKPRRILEIGTFTGYSALCLAEGLDRDGLLYTLEANEEVLPLARTYFTRSPWARQIISLQGDALELLDDIEESFDLVFIDADKKSNELYVLKLLPRLPAGALLLVDNVLWNGKVVAGDIDPDTVMIREMNERLCSLSELEAIILPVRDGILLLRKK